MKMEAALNRLQANKHDAGGWLIFWDFANEAVIEFDVVRVPCRGPKGNMVFEDGDGFQVVDMLDAATYMHGTIRFDGCSNWYFDEQDRVMLHFCGMDGVFDLARVFETSYEIAKANIANFCG
jgi:hypothetical protein